MGHVLLEGGNEFRSGMQAADRRAIALAGGTATSIRIIPAAAAPDGNDRRAGASAVGWFRSLGANEVQALPIIDRPSADRPELANQLETAGLVFMLGGFTRHLAQTLAGSRSWEAMKAAHRRGAVIGGSSAGAMVLCEFFFDSVSGKVSPGLNLLPGVCVLPHYEVFGKGWVAPLLRLLPGALLIGIDEETGLLNDAPGGQWTVYGKGGVTVHAAGGQSVLHHGQQLRLPVEPGR